MPRCTFILFISFIIISNYLASEAKVFMILMDEEPAISLQNEQSYLRLNFFQLSYSSFSYRLSYGIFFFWLTGYFAHHHRNYTDDAVVYKERISSGHDRFLESLLHRDSYTKLYSYTHLTSGFAIHVESEEVH